MYNFVGILRVYHGILGWDVAAATLKTMKNSDFEWHLMHLSNKVTILHFDSLDHCWHNIFQEISAHLKAWIYS